MLPDFEQSGWNEERVMLERAVRQSLIHLIDHLGPVTRFTLLSDGELPFEVLVCHKDHLGMMDQ